MFVERLWISSDEPELWHVSYVVYRQATWRYLCAELASKLILMTAGPQRRIDRWEAKDIDLEKLEFTNQMPFSVRLDLWWYDFSHAGRTVVQEWVDPALHSMDELRD